MDTLTISRSNIERLLHEGIATIKFIKKDGSERIMKCTLVNEIIEPYEKKTDRVKAINDNVMSVWDVENNGWRSINLDAILDVYK